MKKFALLTLCAAMLIPLATNAQAQPGDSFGPPDSAPRGDDFRGPRRGGGGLMRVWRGIERLEKDGPALSKDQAKSMVALILPWSKKSSMTPDQVKRLRPQIEAVLTSAQKNALENDRPPVGRDGNGPRGEMRGGGGFRGDGPPRGGARRGGERRGGQERGFGGPRADWSEAQGEAVRSWMGNSNPFYAPTGVAGWKNLPADFQKNAARRYQENRALLEALSRKSR